jgi:hypothetical protein
MSAKTRPSFTPSSEMSDAVEHGDTAAIARILARPGGAETRDSYARTGLHEAAAKGDLALVALLIRGGVPLDASDDGGLTALSFAADRRTPAEMAATRHGEAFAERLQALTFDAAARAEITAALDAISKAKSPELRDEPFDRLADAAVEWHRANGTVPRAPDPDLKI